MNTTAKVDLVMEDGTKKQVEVTYKRAIRTQTNLDRIDDAVEKAFKDEAWVRWNLIDLGY